MSEAEIAELLSKLCDARREYAARPTPPAIADAILHEAEVLENVSYALAGLIPWSTLVACYAPSWRWAEFGEHEPLRDPAVAAGEQAPREDA